MVNTALDLQPPQAEESITVKGSNWYYAVAAIMAFSGLVFAGMMMRLPRSHRIFHYITILIVFVASIAYFTMGSDLGVTPVQAEFFRDNRGRTRQIFYARYIDWVITTPLLLMDLLLTAGLPWPTILWTIVIDEIMIITGLIGALVVSSYKWGYWVFGTVAMFFVFYNILWVARKHATVIGSDVSRLFLVISGLTIVLWTLYPIAWGLSEGGNVISSDGEAYFYGVLDFFAKPVFGFILLFGHRNIDPSRLGLRVHDYNQGSVSEGSLGREKHGVTGHHHTTNGTHHTTATTTTSAV